MCKKRCKSKQTRTLTFKLGKTGRDTGSRGDAAHSTHGAITAREAGSSRSRSRARQRRHHRELSSGCSGLTRTSQPWGARAAFGLNTGPRTVRGSRGPAACGWRGPARGCQGSRRDPVWAFSAFPSGATCQPWHLVRPQAALVGFAVVPSHPGPTPCL